MAEKKESGKPRKGKFYRVEGDSLKREKHTCPKCGAGVFMAGHKGRTHCGKCGYAEMGGVFK